MSRVDKAIDFDWNRNAPDPAIACDHFQAHWQGVLNVPEKGSYTFEAEVDDNIRLVIDGQTLLDYNPDKASELQSDAQEAKNYLNACAKVRLEAGQHEIEVFYEERDVNALVKLYWSSKKMPKQIVSNFSIGGLLPCEGLQATYTCQQPWLCYTQGKDALYAIALEFPEDQLVLSVDKPAETMQVTLLGCNKTLPWKYKDGQLFVDTSGLKISDVAGTAAWVFRMR